MPETTLHDLVPTPVGDILLIATDEGLSALWFEERRHPSREDAGPRLADDDTGRAATVLRDARRELMEYLAGTRTTFTVPLAMRGTAFQLRVWEALRAIPYGETVSYLELSRRLGEEAAIRAVAATNGRNPVAIMVPCHRVVGADGKLVGFGGGLHRKRWLLAHEQRHHPLTLTFERGG